MTSHCTTCRSHINTTTPTLCDHCAHPPTTRLCRWCGTRLTLPADHTLGAHLDCNHRKATPP